MNCFKLCSFQINFWVGTAVSAAPDQPPLQDSDVDVPLFLLTIVLSQKYEIGVFK
jgi:hypothetical protein